MMSSISKLMLCLSLSVLVTACAGTQLNYLANPIPAQQMRKQPQDIEVMYDGPGRPYDVLGLIDCSRYEPGFSDPGLLSVLPEIRFKASQVGGDGVIVRRSQSGGRSIDVAAEVIRYRD